MCYNAVMVTTAVTWQHVVVLIILTPEGGVDAKQ